MVSRNLINVNNNNNYYYFYRPRCPPRALQRMRKLSSSQSIKMLKHPAEIRERAIQKFQTISWTVGRRLPEVNSWERHTYRTRLAASCPEGKIILGHVPQMPTNGVCACVRLSMYVRVHLFHENNSLWNGEYYMKYQCGLFLWCPR